MKRKLTLLIAILILSAFCFCSCSQQTVKGNRVTGGTDYQTFQYAYIILGDKLIAEGNITYWRDYQSGDEIQIQIGDKVYLTHYANVVMVTSAGTSMNYSSYQDYND